METLSGSVERITYYNPENGYTAVSLRPVCQRCMQDAISKSGLSADGPATVVGNLTEVSPGEFFRLQWHWEPRWPNADVLPK